MKLIICVWKTLSTERRFKICVTKEFNTRKLYDKYIPMSCELYARRLTRKHFNCIKFMRSVT